MTTEIAPAVSLAKMFEDNLPLIERVIAYVVRTGGLVDAEAEDFASAARLALMANEFAVLARFDGRAALATYLVVVVKRLLFEYRDHQFGRWRSSAEAKRMGDAAVLLEKLLVRDRRPFHEAAQIVRESHADVSESQMEEMVKRFPRRVPRLRPTVLDDLPEDVLAAGETASRRVDDGEQHRVCDTATRVLRETLAAMTPEDRALLRWRFGFSVSISNIARMLRVPQRPLYRRVEALLQQIHDALAAAGIDNATIGDVIGSASSELDFGLTAMSAQFQALNNLIPDA